MSTQIKKTIGEKLTYKSLRIPVRLSNNLKVLANKNNRSLNAEIIFQLEQVIKNHEKQLKED